MPVNLTIQADVVDIRADTPQTNDVFWVDSNVWYWMSYTGASMSWNRPRPYQTRDYPSYVLAALGTKSKLFCCTLSLAELAHRIEATEFEVFATSNGLDERQKKDFRHNYPPARAKVVKEITTAWGQVKTMAGALVATVDDALATAALNRLATQALDGYDSFMLEAIAKAGVNQVITDDGDADDSDRGWAQGWSCAYGNIPLAG